MATGFVIGIDGGQTATRCLLATTDGQVLGEGAGGGLIHLAAAGGRERFVASVGEALGAVWLAAGLELQPVAAIALGLTGVEAGTAEDAQVRALLPRVADAARVVVQNDGVAALYGAHGGEPGVVVISGTGTIAWGMDARGTLARAGGWGWLLQDAGSACAIGRDGLVAALAGYDGTAPPTLLTEAFAARLGVASIADTKRIVYAPDFGAAGFAALADVVSQTARQGDVTAARLIAEAGTALARAAIAVLGKLNSGDRTARVAGVGGAFEHVAGLRDVFVAELKRRRREVEVRDPLQPPVRGALLMALRELALS